MKEIFETLVAYPTVTANQKANHEALEYIEDFLRERGMFTDRFNFDGYGSLVATTRNTKSPKIMLAAHLDVVPAPPRLFKLQEKDGKFFGRGSCDMKFAIAAYLQIVDDLRGKLGAYDFGIMITTDEEIGGHNGVPKLLEQGYSSQACILPDGGENWALEQSAKGIIWVKAIASGLPAHSSRPWEGESAIEKMMQFLQATQRDLFSEQGEGTSTLTIGTIEGGNAANQVADLCTAYLDIRTIDRDTQQHILEHIAVLATEYNMSYEIEINDPPINLDLANPYIVAYGKSLEKVTGQPLRTMKSNGASDARYFAKYDIPTIVAYPPGGGRHSDKEWMGVDSFYTFRDLLHDYLSKTAKR